MKFFRYFLLGALSLVFLPFALATHKDSSPNVINKPSNKQDIRKVDILVCVEPDLTRCVTVQYNITAAPEPLAPCELLPEAVWENLGSIAPDAGIICRLWSEPSCQESTPLAIISKPGEADLADRGKEARYISCVECQECQ